MWVKFLKDFEVNHVGDVVFMNDTTNIAQLETDGVLVVLDGPGE